MILLLGCNSKELWFVESASHKQCSALSVDWDNVTHAKATLYINKTCAFDWFMGDDGIEGCMEYGNNTFCRFNGDGYGNMKLFYDNTSKGK